MPTLIPPELIQETAFSVTQDVLNRGEAMAIDRHDLPLLDALWNSRKTDAGSATDTTRVNLKVAGEVYGQYWNRRDRLGFQENHIDLTLEYEFVNLHFGLEFVHTDLLSQGYSIQYNKSRGKGFAKKIPADEVNRLANIFEEKVETHLDNIKVFTEEQLFRDGTQVAGALVGLDALVPVSATAGTIGAKSRAGYPILQHTVRTGLTVGASGDIYVQMVQGMRQARLLSRGQGRRKYRLFAGSAFLDGYAAYIFASGGNARFQSQLGKVGKIDLAYQDGDLAFQGLPFTYVPLLDKLDQQGVANNGVPYSNRCYAVETSAIEVRCPSGMDMQMSFPDDPADQRFTRMSTDMRLAVVNKNPNSHALFAIA